eukprot:scaffold7067_cov139-Isochrysis_galbana.AAC.3
MTGEGDGGPRQMLEVEATAVVEGRTPYMYMCMHAGRACVYSARQTIKTNEWGCLDPSMQKSANAALFKALSESVIGLCSFRQLHADDIWLKAEGKSAVKGQGTARAGRTPPDGGAAPASPMAARCARWPSPAAPARPRDPFTQPPRYGARH